MTYWTGKLAKRIQLFVPTTSFITFAYSLNNSALVSCLVNRFFHVAPAALNCSKQASHDARAEIRSFLCKGHRWNYRKDAFNALSCVSMQKKKALMLRSSRFKLHHPKEEEKRFDKGKAQDDLLSGYCFQAPAVELSGIEVFFEADRNAQLSAAIGKLSTIWLMKVIATGVVKWTSSSCSIGEGTRRWNDSPRKTA